MKTAIELLTSKRAALRQELAHKTTYVLYYTAEIDKAQYQIEKYQRQILSEEENMQRCCAARTEVQVQLNEIDAAIAKLSEEQ